MEAVRVVFLWDSMQEVSGVTTFLSNCLRSLPQYGVEPTVVELQWPGEWWGTWTSPLRDNVVAAQQRLWQTPLGYRRSVVRKIARLRPHLLIMNDQRGWEYLATFRERVPVIDIMHVDTPDRRAWEQIASRAHELAALIGGTDHIASKLGDLAGAAGKVFNIPYGVSGAHVPRELPATEGPVILFAGRIIQVHKRARDLVPFVKALEQQLEKFSLLIVGDGPEKAYLDKALSGYAPRVTLAGNLEKAELERHYRRAHFFIQLSEFEGLSQALLESMAYGAVPVVTAIASGVGQVIEEGRNGFLFPIGQPEVAARLIKACLPRWEEVSRRASQTVAEQFGVERMCQRYAEVFRQLAGKPLERPLAYVDEHYPRLWGRIARRALPILIYRNLLKRVV